MNSNWGYSPETFNSDHNRRFLSRVSLKFYGWSWKIILHESLRIVSKPSVNSNWSYSPKTPNLGQNRRFFSCVTLKFDGWPWNTIEQHQALCIISSSYVNSNWSYRPETVKLGFDICDLDLWPLISTFCMALILSWVIISDDFMMVRWWEHGEKGVTDGLPDGPTDRLNHS